MKVRALTEGVIHLWLAFESQLDDAPVEDYCRSWMSEAELASEAKFLVEGARRLHVLARALQRVVLASYLPGVAPRDLNFVRSATGRPSLAPPFDAAGLEFNLAHTRGLVVLAAGVRMRLGVDVEARGKNVPLEAARRYFSVAEVAGLDALPADAQPERFLRLWTLKEAYLKAIGTGIAGGLGNMTFHLDAAPRLFERAEDPDASRWRFRQYSIGEHLVALASAPEQAPLSVEWHEFTAGTEQAVSAPIRSLLG